MYEPIFVPDVEKRLLPLGEVRFGLSHFNSYRAPHDLRADPLHMHKYTEIFFHVAGDMSFFIGDRLYPISVGDAVISRADEVHMGVYNSPSVFEHFCLWIDADLNSPLISFLAKWEDSPILSFDSETAKTLIDNLSELDRIMGKEGSELESTAKFLNILTVLKKKSMQRSTEINIPAALSAILDYINENYTQIRHVNELVTSHFVSSATLNRWFREYLHISPREYIESKKLANSVRLLTSGASVTEACMRSGFPDCSHFVVLFKRKFGKTPLQYKKEL